MFKEKKIYLDCVKYISVGERVKDVFCFSEDNLDVNMIIVKDEYGNNIFHCNKNDFLELLEFFKKEL